jgi:hypothetical protein
MLVLASQNFTVHVFDEREYQQKVDEELLSLEASSNYPVNMKTATSLCKLSALESKVQCL